MCGSAAQAPTRHVSYRNSGVLTLCPSDLNLLQSLFTCSSGDLRYSSIRSYLGLWGRRAASGWWWWRARLARRPSSSSSSSGHGFLSGRSPSLSALAFCLRVLARFSIFGARRAPFRRWEKGIRHGIALLCARCTMSSNERAEGEVHQQKAISRFSLDGGPNPPALQGAGRRVWDTR